MINKMKKGAVLVTGAAGGVGRTVCRALLNADLKVKGLVRPEDRIENLPLNQANLVTGYIEDPEAVSEAMRGVDAVVRGGLERFETGRKISGAKGYIFFDD
jgi:uncharacterized protein YbjT (DUF2867 family)